MKTSRFTQRFLSVFLSVVAAVMVVSLMAYATTIGTNVSVSGTFTVTGASNLNGNATFGDAAADLITSSGQALHSASTTLDAFTFISDDLAISGRFTATSTLRAGGLATFDAAFISSASSTVVGAFTVSDGALLASSTSAFTGEARFIGGLVTLASSTHASGVLNVGSRSLGVGSSTPNVFELGVEGDVGLSSSATTTLHLSSQDNTTGAASGGCIEMEATDGVKYRMYIAKGIDNVNHGTSTPGRASGSLVAVWEPGGCQVGPLD